MHGSRALALLAAGSLAGAIPGGQDPGAGPGSGVGGTRVGAAGVVQSTSQGDVSFEFEVRPILVANCLECHGPERHKAGLRLDLREEALLVIDPGEAATSLLIERVSDPDEDERMPPKGERLRPEQVATLRRWIDAGASWPEGLRLDARGDRDHWAYRAPLPPAVPAPSARHADWVRGPIDAFVLRRVLAAGFEPAPEAPRATLLRRLSLDLTGLPPTVVEVADFESDASPAAYQRQVERLLASPRFGEHQARLWLDLARYADSHGYEKDERRVMWPYRDWVIEAFNRDLPFDRFTIEQLAGDLLPEPDLSQLVATGFHRNTMINQEGGTDPEEFRVAAVVDRVNTTATVWMGTTMACVQCHEHKYDPFTHEEYYRFFAFFNSTLDTGNNVAPTVPAPTSEQRAELESLALEIGELRARLEAPEQDSLEALRAIDPSFPPWPAPTQIFWENEVLTRTLPPTVWEPLRPAAVASREGATLRVAEDRSVTASGAEPARDVYTVTLDAPPGTYTGLRLEALRSRDGESGPGRARHGNFVLSDLTLERVDAAGRRHAVELISARSDHEQARHFRAQRAIDLDPLSGWAVGGFIEREDLAAVFGSGAPFTLTPGQQLQATLRFESQHARHVLGRFRLSVTGNRALLDLPAAVGASPWSLAGPFPAAPGREAQEQVHPVEARALAGDRSGSEWRERADLLDGTAHTLGDEVGAYYLARTLTARASQPVTLRFGSDDSLRVWLDCEPLLENLATRGVGPDQDHVALELAPGEHELLIKIGNHGGAAAFWFDLDVEDGEGLPRPVVEALFTQRSERSEEQRRLLREHYRRQVAEEWKPLYARLDELEARRETLDGEVAKAMVLTELAEPRATHVHLRGSFLSKGAAVQPDVPAVLPPLPDGAPRDRLTLARWLVSDGHPLAARVRVNRLWEQIFGLGLVETSEDFGIRGDPPSHPELLDWLALEQVALGWSTKELLRLIVTSSTYRQSSRVTPALLERDPRNRLLARGARHRLEGEVVRDVALAVAGLLSDRIGGPSVFPPQPEGTWAMTYSSDSWETSSGEDRWRRGLYTFWRRTAPYPTFALFDAPSRELTCVRRSRTNTPLQALALLNDPVFVEAAAGLGRRMIAVDRRKGAEAALRHGFRLCLARAPTAEEHDILLRFYTAEFLRFNADAEAARRLAQAANIPGAQPIDAPPLRIATFTAVASVLLNLDETITRN